MEAIPTTFGQRFLNGWLRWGVWILCLGIGYHGGEFLVLSLRGDAAIGLFVFITGLVGYVVGAFVVGAIIALIAAALPGLRILPTSIFGGALRAVCIGLILGAVTVYSDPRLFGRADAATPSTTANPKTQDARSTCVGAYYTHTYASALDACKSMAFEYVPRLQAMAQTNDPHVLLDDTWDMLRATYVMAFGYKQDNESTIARQSALHAVGWAIYSLGAISQLDPKSANVRYVSMKSEIARDLVSLNGTFPGVVDEERKAFNEANH